jgi:hypothetical protein
MLPMCVTRALTNSQLYSGGWGRGDSLQAANVHCLLIDLSIDWTAPSRLSCNQQQWRLCFCYRTHKFLKSSFNSRSFSFSEFHDCIGTKDKAIVLNLWLAWFEAMKRSPTDDRDSSSRDFLFLLIIYKHTLCTCIYCVLCCLFCVLCIVSYTFVNFVYLYLLWFVLFVLFLLYLSVYVY